MTDNNIKTKHMMENYHAEKTILLERKIALRMRKKIDRAGFVESLSDLRLGKIKTSSYRIVIYHKDLQQLVDKIYPNQEQWKEKYVV